jgi:putative ABC transport system permease protein
VAFLQDARFALRLLTKSPLFTAVAVLTLAIGIAANTVMFSVLDAVILRPLPYPDAARLVQVHTGFPGLGFDTFWVSAPEYRDIAKDTRAFESIGAWGTGRANVTDGDRKLVVNEIASTASLLPMLGVQPALGRFFTEAEDQPGDPSVVILGHGLWTRAFGADPAIIGKTIHVDAIPVRVVGVMPKGFDFPGNDTELYVPGNIDYAKASRGGHYLYVVGRLRGGTSIEQLRAELLGHFPAWAEGNRHVFREIDHPIKVVALQEEVTAPVRASLVMLQAAVLFVLLISCANVSNLLLARAEARSAEIAIRTAVGAGRGRMARQFLTESLVLGLLGAGLGILLAVWGVDATLHLLPEGAPRAKEIGIDGTVLGFAVGSGIACSLVFGLTPILHSRHSELGVLLRAAGHRSTGSAAKQRFRRALVVVQVALAVVLVVGAGVMIRSFVRLQQVDPGFRPEGLAFAEVQLPEKTYVKDEEVVRFWENLQREAGALPGVASASIVRGLPPSRRHDVADVEIVGEVRDRTTGRGRSTEFWQVATPEAFETLGLRLVEGRLFTAADNGTAPGVVVVNQAFAKRYFPGQSAIGKQVRVAGWLDKIDPQTIIGVVADVKQQGMDAPAGTETYVPLVQSNHTLGDSYRIMSVVVRAKGDPRALLAGLRASVAAVDPTLPIAHLDTMDRVMYDALAKPRFVTTLLTVFAGIALLMAAIGIYGVMSYSVEQRTQELGIRMALGAAPAVVQRMLLRQGFVLAAAGLACGLVVSFALDAVLARAFATLVFEPPRFDVLTHVLVGVLMTGVSLLACWVPARRATRIPPMVAMRHE